MPLIGVTTYSINGQGEIPLPFQYVDSVRRAGGIPLLIPPGETQLESVLDTIDGLVLAGGGDICPSRYGGRGHETIYMVNPERDETELRLVDLLLARRLPTLAICRGLQILNVALGGTLHPHLPDVVGEQVTHRLPPREPTLHPIRLTPDSRLVATLETEHLSGMSWHHQAIDQLGRGVRPVAHAEDGVVEAIELDDRPELVAVQWHPELTSHDDPAQQALFDQLIQRSHR